MPVHRANPELVRGAVGEPRDGDGARGVGGAQRDPGSAVEGVLVVGDGVEVGRGRERHRDGGVATAGAGDDGRARAVGYQGDVRQGAVAAIGDECVGARGVDGHRHRFGTHPDGVDDGVGCEVDHRHGARRVGQPPVDDEGHCTIGGDRDAVGVVAHRNRGHLCRWVRGQVDDRHGVVLGVGHECLTAIRRDGDAHCRRGRRRVRHLDLGQHNRCAAAERVDHVGISEVRVGDDGGDAVRGDGHTGWQGVRPVRVGVDPEVVVVPIDADARAARIEQPRTPLSVPPLRHDNALSPGLGDRHPGRVEVAGQAHLGDCRRVCGQIQSVAGGTRRDDGVIAGAGDCNAVQPSKCFRKRRIVRVVDVGEFGRDDVRR